MSTASPAKGQSARRVRPFVRFATAGTLFQGGAAALDTANLVGAFLYGITDSTAAVGAAAMLSRIGWQVPQLIVAHLAQHTRRHMPFYVFGAFGRATAIGLLALAVGAAGAADLGQLAPAAGREQEEAQDEDDKPARWAMAILRDFWRLGASAP